MMRNLTARLVLTLAALCAVSAAHAPSRAARGQGLPWHRPNDGKLFPVEVKWKHGYVDRAGKLVIGAKYDHAGPFSDGVAVVSHGLITEVLGQAESVTGNTVSIPVEPGGMQWEIIDESGKVVARLTPNLDYRESVFSEGLATFPSWVEGRGSVYGYMDKTGKTVIEPRFARALPFRGGLAPACAAPGRCGFIDRAGEPVVRPVYTEVRPFSDGLAQVRDAEGLAGYVDGSGELVIPPQFNGSQPGDFNEGLAPAAYPGTKFGFIDRLGHFAVRPQFDGAGVFNEGLAPVLAGDRMGYVDREGRFVIPARFVWAQSFSDGLAAASDCYGAAVALRAGAGEPCGFGFIDKTGKFVIAQQFDLAESFFGGLAPVLLRGGRGYVDREGKLVWDPARR